MEELELKNQIDKKINDIGSGVFSSEKQYINDLKFPFKINTSVPTHQPKKFVDCFWVRDNAGTKELYIFVGGTWEQII